MAMGKKYTDFESLPARLNPAGLLGAALAFLAIAVMLIFMSLGIRGKP